MERNKNYGIVALMVLTALFSGCSSSSVSTRTSMVDINSVNIDAPLTEEAEMARGTTTVVWEEPMIDVVDVPPGLDPEGHYYRPAHQAVVEIRQGRYQYYQRGRN